MVTAIFLPPCLTQGCLPTDPLGLPQEAMEACFKIQTEITSHISRIDNVIKKRNRDHEHLCGPTEQTQLKSVGPLNPDCVLREEEFSPMTDLGDSTAPTKDRDFLRQQRLLRQSDFSSSVSEVQMQSSISCCKPSDSVVEPYHNETRSNEDSSSLHLSKHDSRAV